MKRLFLFFLCLSFNIVDPMEAPQKTKITKEDESFFCFAKAVTGSKEKKFLEGASYYEVNFKEDFLGYYASDGTLVKKVGFNFDILIELMKCSWGLSDTPKHLLDPKASRPRATSYQLFHCCRDCFYLNKKPFSDSEIVFFDKNKKILASYKIKGKNAAKKPFWETVSGRFKYIWDESYQGFVPKISIEKLKELSIATFYFDERWIKKPLQEVLKDSTNFPFDLNGVKKLEDRWKHYCGIKTKFAEKVCKKHTIG